MFGNESKRRLAENVGPALDAIKDASRSLVAIAVVACVALAVSIIALVRASRPA